MGRGRQKKVIDHAGSDDEDTSAESWWQNAKRFLNVGGAAAAGSSSVDANTKKNQVWFAGEKIDVRPLNSKEVKAYEECKQKYFERAKILLSQRGAREYVETVHIDSNVFFFYFARVLDSAQRPTIEMFYSSSDRAPWGKVGPLKIDPGTGAVVDYRGGVNAINNVVWTY